MLFRLVANFTDQQLVNALQAAGEVRDGIDAWTWGRLREETARIRAGLVDMGVAKGDRVVGYLPHVPETVAAFLAVSSLGATWSCCSPAGRSRPGWRRLWGIWVW